MAPPYLTSTPTSSIASSARPKSNIKHTWWRPRIKSSGDFLLSAEELAQGKQYFPTTSKSAKFGTKHWANVPAHGKILHPTPLPTKCNAPLLPHPPPTLSTSNAGSNAYQMNVNALPHPTSTHPTAPHCPQDNIQEKVNVVHCPAPSHPNPPQPLTYIMFIWDAIVTVIQGAKRLRLTRMRTCRCRTHVPPRRINTKHFVISHK